MKLLLDTHFLIWLAIEPEELSVAERKVLERSCERYVSAISIWELRIKWNQIDRYGNRKGALDPVGALRLLDDDLRLAEVSAADFAHTPAVPLSHRDPFDEMLIVHAERLAARLLTRDEKLFGHPLALQP